MGFQLNQLLKELEENGYFLFGEKNKEKIMYGNEEYDKWNVATLIIRNKDNSEIIKMDFTEAQ